MALFKTISGSQTNLIRHLFKALQGSEYLQNVFSKRPLVSSSGAIELERALAKAMSNQTIFTVRCCSSIHLHGSDENTF